MNPALETCDPPPDWLGRKIQVPATPKAGCSATYVYVPGANQYASASSREMFGSNAYVSPVATTWWKMFQIASRSASVARRIVIAANRTCRPTASFVAIPLLIGAQITQQSRRAFARCAMGRLYECRSSKILYRVAKRISLEARDPRLALLSSCSKRHWDCRFPSLAGSRLPLPKCFYRSLVEVRIS